MTVKQILKCKSLINGRCSFLEANTAHGKEAAFARPVWSGSSVCRGWSCSGLSCDCRPAGIRAGAGAKLAGESSFQLKFRFKTDSASFVTWAF